MSCSSVPFGKRFVHFSPLVRTFNLFYHCALDQDQIWKNLRLSMANEPPKKRTKKEISETSHNNDIEENTLVKYTEIRKSVCESVADFKFNKKRVRLISANADMSESCKGIAYWMWREQRVQGKLILFLAKLRLSY